MKSFNELQIITTNIMEGTGFKSFFEQKKSEYKINLDLVPNGFSLSDFNINRLTEKTLVILDTDSFEDSSLLDFLQELNIKEIKCVLYSKLSTPGLVIKARQLLISGYVSKSSSLECLLDCLNIVELGGSYYDTKFSGLIKEITDFEQTLSLTQRNLFYEAILFNNRTISDLAALQKTSKHAVEVHLSHIYHKAGVNNYNELINRFSL